MKRPTRLIIFILLIIVALSIVKITVENSISTTGAELARLETDINGQERANEILKERYLESSSLTALSQKAEKNGFIDAQSQVYLSAPLPLALRQ